MQPQTASQPQTMAPTLASAANPPEPVPLRLRRTERRLGGVLEDAAALLSAFFTGYRVTATDVAPAGPNP